MELGKRVVVRWPIDTDIIDPDFFERLQIVINNHAARTYDRHLAHFARLQPAALNGSETFVAKQKREIGHVFHAGSDVRIPLTIHGQRQLVQNVENDGDVVRREIPDDIDILLKESQIEAASVDIANISDVAGTDDVAYLFDGRRIEKSMAAHEDNAFFVGDLDQLLAFRR